jgi:hypothetical protein
MILLVPIGPCFFDFSIKRLGLISRLGLFAKFLTLQLKHCTGLPSFVVFALGMDVLMNTS